MRSTRGEAALCRVMTHMEVTDWTGESEYDFKQWARAARGSKALAEWTEFVIYNMPLEEESTWAPPEAEGWVDVWKPRRLLNLRIRFEHSSWQRVCPNFLEYLIYCS